MVKQVKFTISKDGNVELSVEGAVGSNCEQLTAPFEQALGSIGKREYKDSYYASHATDQETTNEQGGT